MQLTQQQRLTRSKSDLNRVSKRFQHAIIIILLTMMGLVVGIGTIELAVLLIQKIISPPFFPLLNIEELLDIFGFFLIILIGIEMMEATKYIYKKKSYM